MTPAANRGRKAKNLNIKEIKTSSKTTITRLTHSCTVDLVEEVPLTSQLNNSRERGHFLLEHKRLRDAVEKLSNR